jgi:hypothetical protein
MAPPEAPTLSAFPLEGGPGGGAPPGPRQIGAIPKMVFEVEMLLDTIARAVPGAAQQVDQAKAIVRGILTKSIPSGGGAGTQPIPPPGMGGGMGGPGGYTP